MHAARQILYHAKHSRVVVLSMTIPFLVSACYVANRITFSLARKLEFAKNTKITARQISICVHVMMASVDGGLCLPRHATSLIYEITFLPALTKKC